MGLPPLANLVAVSVADPALLASIEDELIGSGEFAGVWRPAAGWVAAALPLPGGEADGPLVRAHGLAFAEGRETVSAGSMDRARDAFRDLAEQTDRSAERLGRVAGDFGFIRFRDGGSATIVRSCGGLVPFYLRRTQQRAAIATRLGDLVRYFPAETDLDPLVNAVWTSGHGFFPDGRTFLAGVSILARGHFARIESGQPMVVGRYWDPRPSRLRRPSEAQAREHAERLRALLIATLMRDLDPEGGNLLTLSGGVDSSSLAALASGTVGRRISTLSILPAPQDLFDHEMSFIEPLAQRFGFERRWSIRLNEETPVELLKSAPAAVFHVIHPALCALPRIAEEAPIRVLFGGEFADEVCGSGFSIPDWAACSPVWSLAPFVRARSDRRWLLRWGKARGLSLVRRPPLPFPSELPGYIRADIRREYRDCFSRIRRRIARDRAPLSHLAARCEADAFVAMNWEAASALGIRRSLPFFTREILELAFDCHPSELIAPGYKKLLRAALRDDVPERNLNRPDKGGWGAYMRAGHASWNTELPVTIQAVVRPEWFPKPPFTIDRREAFGLTQLVVFLSRLKTRQLQRGQHAGVRSDHRVAPAPS